MSVIKSPIDPRDLKKAPEEYLSEIFLVETGIFVPPDTLKELCQSKNFSRLAMFAHAAHGDGHE